MIPPFDVVRRMLFGPRSRILQFGLAALIGLAGTSVAGTIWSIGGSLVTNLDWAIYDRWALQQSGPSHASLLLVGAQESPGEVRPSTSWDRASLARAIAALRQAGASAIGIDEYMTAPSGPDHGGAASDALLAEAMADSGRAVIPLPLLAHEPRVEISRSGGTVQTVSRHGSWLPVHGSADLRLIEAAPLAPLLPGMAEAAAGVAHQVSFADPDGRIRRLPLFVQSHDQLVPAFGLSLFITAHHIGADAVQFRPGHLSIKELSPSVGKGSLTVPVDSTGQLILPRLAGHHQVTALELSTLMQAVQRKDREQLRSWADNKIVLLPHTDSSQQASDGSERLVQQLVLLDGLFTSTWVSQLSTPWVFLITLFLASAGTWLLIEWKDWRGLLGVSAAALLYCSLVWVGLSFMQVSLPLFLPLGSLALAGLGTVLWNHLSAAQQLRAVEGNVVRVQAELAAVREALVYQESSVEQLEEDLEQARAEGLRASDREQSLTVSAMQVQRELDEARLRESETRTRLAQLEQELSGLRVASLSREPIAESELEALRVECEQLGILTRDARLLRTFRDVKRGAQSSLPVLILGESGTGKELFARAVHQLSVRHSHPFIAVNMAAISPELFESELFGHVRGSFTGATQDRPGYFALAARGTIFLDEVADLRPEHQAKLLRVLQDRTFYPVGATRPTLVDVRIVAATNKDLSRGIAEGWFREDLYARLKGLVVTLPALRERVDDLSCLADHFLKQAAQQTHRQVPSLTNDAVAALRRYYWPHNVRELAQCLVQAVALSDAPLLHAEDLRLPDMKLAPAPPGRLAPTPEASGDAAVLECLRRHGFDMQAAARSLGWDRSTVTQRLKGLCFQTLVDTQGDKAKAAMILAQDPALVRTVELKLLEYMEHLVTVLSAYRTTSEAIAGCRKRFKNLPDRHFKAVEILIARQFDLTRTARPG